MNAQEMIRAAVKEWRELGSPTPPAWLVGVVAGAFILKALWNRRPGRLAAEIREHLSSDPGYAMRLYKSGGKPAPEIGLAPGEVLDLFFTLNRADQLHQEVARSYPAAYLLDLCVQLADRGNTPMAITLLSDGVLDMCAADPAAAGRLVGLYARPGRLKELARVRCAGRGHAVAAAMAKALFAHGPDGAEHAAYLLDEMTERSPEEEALLTQALLASERPEPGLRRFRQKPRNEWTDMDYEVCFRLLLRGDYFKEAVELYPDFCRRRPPQTLPELHYAFAEGCERLGDKPYAAKVYAALGAFKDSAARKGRLG